MTTLFCNICDKGVIDNIEKHKKAKKSFHKRKRKYGNKLILLSMLS